MSASLVGSEMCIRDRDRPAAAPGVLPRLQLGRPPTSGARGRRMPASQRAVSYTHLTLPTICSV
eukprot:13371081-Alexandrium_andersonii.AAC.1